MDITTHPVHHLLSVSTAPRAARTPPRRSSTTGLMGRLAADWAAMSRRPTVVRRARSWSLGVEFSDLDDLLRHAGFRQQTVGLDDSQDAERAADDVLGRLVLAARHDELAARVVLQRLLPGLSAAARRWSGDRRGGSTDAFGEIVSAAWVVIRAYPVERRPGRFAAKLLRDAEHQAFVKATRRRWTSEAALFQIQPLSMLIY
ncbi:MAG: hypothetical protein ACO3C1_00575 [Ilumatobacteraceae bacterium]